VNKKLQQKKTHIFNASIGPVGQTPSQYISKILISENSFYVTGLINSLNYIKLGSLDGIFCSSGSKKK
jgi:hypothetical protein